MLSISRGFLTMYAINSEGFPPMGKHSKLDWRTKISKTLCVADQLGPEGYERLHVAATTHNLHTNVESEVQWWVLQVS